MNCTNCGGKMKIREKFCTKCGAAANTDLNIKRIRPNVMDEQKKEKSKSFGFSDLGKDGIPGSKLAAFGLILTLLTIVMGSSGALTAFIAVILLVSARIRGFKSIWIWMGIVCCFFLYDRATAISYRETQYSNALFFNNVFGFLDLFF